MPNYRRPARRFDRLLGRHHPVAHGHSRISPQYPRVGRGAAPPPEGIRPASGTGAACLRAPLVVRSLVRQDKPWAKIGEGEQILAFGITCPVCPGARPAGTLGETTTAFGMRLRTNGVLGPLQSWLGD